MKTLHLIAIPVLACMIFSTGCVAAGKKSCSPAAASGACATQSTACCPATCPGVEKCPMKCCATAAAKKKS